MNQRWISLVLLAVNLGLLGVIGYLVYALGASPGPTNYVTRTRMVTNAITQIAVRKINATNLIAALANRALNWAAIESTNYAIYIAHMQAFGVPDETIRDIIIADVSKLYARRRAALRAQARPYRFWQTGEAWENGGASDPAIQAELRRLDAEQRGLIRELLGADFPSDLARYSGSEEAAERMYGFLTPEKRNQVTELQEKYEEMQQELYARTKGLLLDEDQEMLKQLDRAHDAELAQTLTPEEYDEYQLRNSNTANKLRYQLNGFDPNEDEFRKIFRLQRTLDDEFSLNLGGNEGPQSEIRAQAQQEAQESLNDEFKKVLGEKRFAEYERAQDDDYKTLVQLTERFALPRETANKVYDMKVAAEKQKERIAANPSLTDEQRRTAITAIARETERSIGQTMDEKTFRTYRKSAAQWLDNLTVLPESAPLEPEPAP